MLCLGQTQVIGAMLRRCLCLSGADIRYGQHGYCRSALLINMGRRKGKIHALHELVRQYLTEHRHAVTQENHVSSKFT